MFLICLFAAFVSAGCMVGPDYARPKTVADINDGFYYAGSNIQDPNRLSEMDRWWENFGDPVTTQLVLEVLENNYDLRASAARVLQSKAALAEVKGRRMPDVSYNLNRDRSKRSFKFGPERFSVLSTTFSQDISIAYVLDLFGKLKRAERAALAEMFSSQATRQGLVNSIVATAINARINIATIQKRLEIARANTESRQQTLEIVERRYSQGLVGPVDVRLARENLAAAKAVEPGIELSLITAHHALDVLLARRPGSSGKLPQTLSDLPDLGSVPVGLPASLLDRRPDVIAAEFALRASSEQIGVSIAQLYPDLTLTGSYGFAADQLHTIFQEDETEAYSLLFRLTAPIFKGGQLRAGIDAARARHAEAAANYASTVLTALKEVEDSLIREQMLTEQLRHIQVRFEEARAAEELSKQRYQRGVEGILTILESERRRRTAENELAILKGQIWTTRVNLFLALGGDWDYQQVVVEK